MESNLFNALQLLIIGMGAVFFILFVVVSGGKFLIRIINELYPDTQEQPITSINTTSNYADDDEIIRAAIYALTKGEGQVVQIEKKSP